MFPICQLCHKEQHPTAEAIWNASHMPQSRAQLQSHPAGACDGNCQQVPSVPDMRQQTEWQRGQKNRNGDAEVRKAAPGSLRPT